MRSNGGDVVASAEYLCNGGRRGGEPMDPGGCRGLQGVVRAFVTTWGTVHVTSFQ